MDNKFSKSNSLNFIVPTYGKPILGKIDENNQQKFYGSTHVDTFDDLLFPYINGNNFFETTKLQDNKIRFKSGESFFIINPMSNYPKLETFDNLTTYGYFYSQKEILTLSNKANHRLSKIYKIGKAKGSKTRSDNFDYDQCAEPKESERVVSTKSKSRSSVLLAPPDIFQFELKDTNMDYITEESENNKENGTNEEEVDLNLVEITGSKEKESNFSRPDFVKKLFEKYEYDDINIWSEHFTKSKERLLNLATIKYVYNKLFEHFD